MHYCGSGKIKPVAIRKLDDISMKNKRVLLRVDFNVPEEGGRIMDDYRIRAAIPTIKAIREQGAARVILLAHRSAKKDGTAPSLQFVVPLLEELLGEDVWFVDELEKAQGAIEAAKKGGILLLENLRRDPGEEKNDSVFAKRLAVLGDVFIQEAFGVLHRKHASTVGLTQLLPAAAGPLVVHETEIITSLRDHPKHPFVAAIGGAKISTKLPLIEKLLPQVSELCLGGALANTVLRAQGVAVGRSVIEENMVETVRAINLTNTKLHVPVDVIVSKSLDGKKHVRTCGVGDVAEDEYILDIGPDTQELFGSVIGAAATAFWNGPMGLAEVVAFRGGTESVAYAFADSAAYTAVGGGDTTVYLTDLHLTEKISFISTGGGAMLKLLSGDDLPGLQALVV